MTKKTSKELARAHRDSLMAAKGWVTAEVASERVGLHLSRIYARAAKGLYRTKKKSGKLYFCEEDLRRVAPHLPPGPGKSIRRQHERMEKRGYLPVRAVEERYKVSASTIRRMIRAGELKCARVMQSSDRGTHRADYVSIEEVEVWFGSREENE